MSSFAAELFSFDYFVYGCGVDGNMGGSIKVSPLTWLHGTGLIEAADSTMVSALVSGGPVSLFYGFIGKYGTY
jgi:hypothetical protein